MLNAFNSQTVGFSSSSNGQSSNSTASFKVIYRSSTTIKVNTTFTSSSGAAGGSSQTYTAWILKNGSAVAVYANFGGQAMNYTKGSSQFGITPDTLLYAAFAGFFEELILGGNQGFYAQASQYFHSTGTSQVTIGNNKVTVTNYALNSPNEVVSGCGSTATYASFTLQVGTPSGTNFPLVTNFQVSGTTTSNGQSQNFSTSLKLMDFTLAS